MSYEKTTWTDLKLQYDSRYNFKDINTGEVISTYDLDQVTGTVLEDGTPINAVNMNKIEQGIYDAHYQCEVLDDKIRSNNISSYLAFCANANTDSLDSAFGKNNTDLVTNIGLQTAMYSWFKGDSKTDFPFTNLKTKNTLDEIYASDASLVEIASNKNIMELISITPFARNTINSKIPFDGNYVTYSYFEVNTTRRQLSNLGTTGVEYSFTSPASGYFNIVCHSSMYSDCYTYFKLSVNDVSILESTTTSYSFMTINKATHLKKGDIIKIKYWGDSSNYAFYYDDIAILLCTDKPNTLPTTVEAGNNIIWATSKVAKSSTPTITDAFTCTKAGTYKIVAFGRADSESYIYKNGSVIQTFDGYDININQDITLAVGDTIAIGASTNSNVTNGHGKINFFGVGISAPTINSYITA